MTNEQAIAELQKEHDLIQGERDLDGSQFAPALLEALAMAIEALKAQDMTLYMNLPEVSAEEVVEILKRNSRFELILSDKDINVRSNDTISRQDAIDGLSNLRPRMIDTYEKDGDPCLKVKAIDVDEMLQRLPPADIQPVVRWIPCSERLPEDYTDVLVWFEYFRYGDYNCLYQTYGIGDYSTEYDSWMINHETGWHKLRVIAWMPLPEPYQGEGEQDE